MIFDNMSYCSSPVSSSGYYKLPPIVTTEEDKQFLRYVINFIDTELSSANQQDREQRYLVYKAAFNKVIEHVTVYKPVLTSIQKEYDDTIAAIKNAQQEDAFLQGKLRTMASEPSTLNNYSRRIDELEERVAFIKKSNARLQKELCDIQAAKEERQKRQQTVETPTRQLKRDTRSIPGLTLEKTTDMKVLQKKYETLDRQVKEINNSLKTRYLPKVHNVKLKETLDEKVAYRDHLLWQSQVYKARVQKLKIALEAAHAYNNVKPPHQTVGDAVTLAFQLSSGMWVTETEKAEGEQTEASQAIALDDDDPEMEQEAEMMLDYIEKFNELFEDGLYEEAAVHAANSPKGILRTQATLAKFRDVQVKHQGRSPLLAFCDIMMSSVKAAGSKPNEALSRDCVAASLKENCPNLVYHWLSQDRLTLSYQLGKMISEHCSCPIPCMCGCQVMAQNVFIQLNVHEGVIFAMLKQGKVYSTIQYARLYNCITSENVKDVLQLNVCQDLVNRLMEGDLSGGIPYLHVTIGQVLLSLAALNKPELAVNLVRTMLHPATSNSDIKSQIMSLQRMISLDKDTTQEQWLTIMQFLSTNGHDEMVLQILSITTVLGVIAKAVSTIQEDRKTVFFSLEIETCSDSHKDDDDDGSSCEMSSRSRDTNSYDLLTKSRESYSYDQSPEQMSPNVSLRQSSPKQSILKKRSKNGSAVGPSTCEISSRNSSSSFQKKKVGHVSVMTSPPAQTSIRDDESEDDRVCSPEQKQPVSKGGGGIRFMNNDPYTSNPESDEESDTE